MHKYFSKHIFIPLNDFKNYNIEENYKKCTTIHVSQVILSIVFNIFEQNKQSQWTINRKSLVACKIFGNYLLVIL